MRIALLPIAPLTAARASAQHPDSLASNPRDWKRDGFSLLLGYHQEHYGFAEIGFGRSILGVVHQPLGSVHHAGAALRANRPSLIACKVGGYMTAGMTMGIAAIRHQKKKHGLHGDRAGDRTRNIQGEVDLCVQREPLAFTHRWHQHAHDQHRLRAFAGKAFKKCSALLRCIIEQRINARVRSDRMNIIIIASHHHRST